MSTRKKDAATPESLRLVVRDNESEQQALARTALRPSVNNAATIAGVARRDFVEVELNALVEELAAQCSKVSRGEMAGPEGLLTAQAHTLDTLFNHLTRLAYKNWDNLEVAERLLRLAFKAQSQSRSTVETIGNLRNPPTVIARQANIAHGPQQVNNDAPTRTREIQSEQSKLLEQTYGERLDTGTSGAGGAADSQLEAVGAVHRAKDT